MNNKLSNLPLIHRGKVADVYEAGENLLLLRTDRVSGLNVKLLTSMPGKGVVLNNLSKWWMNGPLSGVVPNHLTGLPLTDYVLSEELHIVTGRAEIVKKLKPIPVEAVVRRHITGTAYQAYKETGEICGIKLPPGLKDGDRLPFLIFTPTEKSDTDPNITLVQMSEIVGSDLAMYILRKSVEMFRLAEAHLSKKGIILADTKFEFGLDENNELTLMDEVLTPDSSRFWLRSAFERDRKIVSMDKQKIRDWMKVEKESGRWDGKSPLSLPDDLVLEVSDDYRRIYELITN